jgi:hypothetical protein
MKLIRKHERFFLTGAIPTRPPCKFPMITDQQALKILRALGQTPDQSECVRIEAFVDEE